MNNSINFSHFADLVVFEHSKEKEIHQSEFISRENTLSIEDPVDEMLCAHIEAEIER